MGEKIHSGLNQTITVAGKEGGRVDLFTAVQRRGGKKRVKGQKQK